MELSEDIILALQMIVTMKTRGANGDGGDDDGDGDNSKVTPRAVLHSVREEKEPREGRYQVIEQISFFVDFNGK